MELILSQSHQREENMLNKITLIGRLGRAPELRYASNGIPIANLRIATDESYTDRDGNKVDRTEWHTVVVFQRQAENCSTYLKKGSLVFVEGSLQTRKWQDQQGQDRYTTEIKASRVQFLDRKNQQSTQYQYEQQNTSEPVPGSNSSMKHNNDIFPSEASGMDDVPF